jgi:hypothetical protein
MLDNIIISVFTTPIKMVFPGNETELIRRIFNTKKLEMNVPNSITMDTMAMSIPKVFVL